jgi:hypothetical protein
MRAIVLAVLVGCTAVPQVDQTRSALATEFVNDGAAFDFFVAKGLTPFQAAGIVGNLDQESGVDPGSVQSGGPGRGIAQWSVGGRWDTSSQDNVLWYAGMVGEASSSLNLQLEFIWYELTQLGYGYSQLRATTNVTDATVVFMQKFEICGTCLQSQRVAYAQAVLAAFGQTPPYAGQFVSQSWPYASTALTVKCGEGVVAQITLENTGNMTWDSSTQLGTTMPRDRASMFAGTEWLSPSRAAAIRGTVAPGTDGTFTFAFDGPTGAACVPGMYHEHFGLVQDGVAWFGDNGQGGPPDEQIEALIDLEPGDPGIGSGSGSGSGSGAGAMPPPDGGGCAAAGGAGWLVGLLAIRRRKRR